jgi:hypothetical protein
MRIPAKSYSRRAAALAALLVAALPGSVRAGGSSPVLAITSASAFADAAAGRSVVVNGTFNFDDLMQFTFPAGLVVWQGTHVVRFDLDGRVSEGSAAFAADGIVAAEIPALLGLGSPAPASARLLQLGVARVAVALPPSFSPGAASVMLYAEFDSDDFPSNTVAVTLP